MRILMAVPKYPYPIIGGQERQAHLLSRELVRLGHTVLVISEKFSSTQETYEIIDGVVIYRIPKIVKKRGTFLLFPLRIMLLLFRLRTSIDVVHVHNVSWFGAFVTIIAEVLGCPVLTKLSGIDKNGIPGMKSRFCGNLRIALLKRSDAIVAMTHENIAELIAINYPLNQVLKVVNGISLDKQEVTPHSRESCEIVAMFVGRISPEKRLDDLLYAWVHVQTSVNGSAKLRLIGDGPQATELKTLTQALGIDESVEFNGYSHDVPDELAQADIFVLPSEGEGNSNAILEAMSAALPIVASNVGGNPIQVGEEGKEFLFAPGNREVLANHLITLIENQTMRKYLGKVMRKRVEDKFSIHKITRVYEDAYHLLAKGKRQQIGQLNPDLFG